MGLFTNHKLTLVAGFVLAAIIIAVGMADGRGPDTGELVYGLARWGHFLAGITWIGLLYYLNFCQVPSLGNVSADTKADLFKDGSIVRRVMWWFRWGAMATLFFGLLLYMNLASMHADGWDIRIGALFGIIMWFNVWFIIWPAQKKIIGVVPGASAEEKAALGKRALIASRTNVILSIPMLLLMGASAHFRFFG